MDDQTRERLQRERDEAWDQLQNDKTLTEREREAVLGHYGDAVQMLAADETRD